MCSNEEFSLSRTFSNFSTTFSISYFAVWLSLDFMASKIRVKFILSLGDEEINVDNMEIRDKWEYVDKK